MEDSALADAARQLGELQLFETRFERMVAWQMRRSPDKSRDAVERETLAFMARMPAWKNHPRVRAAGAPRAEQRPHFCLTSASLGRPGESEERAKRLEEKVGKG